jgi:hypothetical protein
MIVLTWRARQRPLLLQFYAPGNLVLILGYLAIRPASTSDANMLRFVIVVVFAVALLFALYPAKRQLWTFSDAQPTPRLLGAALLSAVILIPLALLNLQRELSGYLGPQASEARWMGAVILCVALVLANFLTASRRPGWVALGTLVSLAYLYLGAAAITVPDQPGSWGVLGGLAAIGAGLA